MINPISFAAACLVAALGSDGHGLRPARIARSADVARVDSDITLAYGKLARPPFRHGLFRVGSLWFQVPPDAPFHDWLRHAQGGQAAVTLTTNAGRHIDAKNTRIFSGKPVHLTVPSVSPVVHLMSLREVVTGDIAVTLQTSDALVASRLETYMGNSVAESRVSIVIRVE